MRVKEEKLRSRKITIAMLPNWSNPTKFCNNIGLNFKFWQLKCLFDEVKLALSFFKLYPKYERQGYMIQRGVWIEPRLVMDVSSSQTPTVNYREAQNCDAKETQLRFKRKRTRRMFMIIAFERRANLPWLKCPSKEYESNQNHFNVSLVQIRMLGIFILICW
jgi:hypothetical protein